VEALPQPTGTSNRDVDIHAIRTGSVRVRGRQLQGVGSGSRRLLNTLLDKRWTPPLPIHAWVVEHPEGVILVDTGEVAKASDPRYYPAYSPYLRRATRMDIGPQEEIGPQLRAIGIDPGQVRWVVLTHLHPDHAGGLAFFPRAEVVLARREYESAKRVDGRLRGYLPQHWPAWFRPRPVEFRGEPVGPFPASWPLTQAGDVLLVPTHGHTHGHLSVVIRQPGQPTLLLAGDASYRQDLMLSGTIDGVAIDEVAAHATLERLQRFVRAEPTVFLPAHDPGSGERFVGRVIADG
jgi:N-acyl homoserine lactone hydrolase